MRRFDHISSGWGRALVVLVLTLNLYGAAAEVRDDQTSQLDWGKNGLPIPTATTSLTTTKETAELIGASIARCTSESTRAAYIHDLASCQPDDAAPFIEAAMEDSSPLVRAEAIRTAVKLRRSELTATVQQYIADKDPRVRREAALAGMFSTTQRKEEPDIAIQAAAIWAAASTEDLQALARDLRTLPHGLRLEAMERLSQAGATWAAANIADALPGDVDERVLAIRVLAGFGATDQWHRIQPLLADRYVAVRREATLAIARLCKVQDRSTLAETMLADPTDWVREAAAIVLRSNPSASSIALLKAQLESANPALHDAARNALVATGQPMISSALEMLKDANAKQRVDGSFILGRLKSDAGFETHVKLLSDSNPAVAAQAAEALGQIGKREAVPALLSLLLSLQKAPDGLRTPVFHQAMIACGRLRDPQVLEVALQHLSDGNASPSTRAACAFAIGRVANGSDIAIANALLSRYYDREESPVVQFESLKALGQAQFLAGKSQLASIASEEFDPELRWMAHWSQDRIAGRPSPYTPPEHRLTPEVSIAAIAESTDEPRIDARLLFDPQVIESAWLPVEITLTNASSSAVDGWVEVALGDGVSVFKSNCVTPAGSKLKVMLFARFPSALRAGTDSSLAMAQWRSNDGRVVSRSPIVGIPTTSSDANPPGAFLLRIHHPTAISDADHEEDNDIVSFAGWLGVVLNLDLRAASIPIELAPRQRIGYDSSPIVLLDRFDLEELDAAQRNALYEHIAAGGVVLLCAPQGESPLLHTWLGPHLPVTPISRQVATQIGAAARGHSLALKTPASLSVATLAEGATVVLEDDSSVHAAYANLGLGRIVFTSFPINALDAREAEVETLWRSLIGRKTTVPNGPDRSKAAAAALAGMMGSYAPPWRSAAVIALLYLAALVLSLSGVLCRDRVKAFAAASGVAVVASVGVIAWATMHQHSVRFSTARLAVTDAESHAALRTDYVSWHGGAADKVSLSARDEHVKLIPGNDMAWVSSEVTMMPLTVSGGAISKGGGASAWRADAVVGPVAVTATVRFTESGLSLAVDNQSGRPLNRVTLFWHRQISIPRMGSRTSNVLVSELGQAHDAQSQSSRGALVESIARTHVVSGDMPLLIAQLDHVPEDDLLKLRSHDGRAASEQTLHLICVPAQLEPPPAGSVIRIDGAFNSIDLLRREGCPYDPLLRRWLPGNQPGQWLLGFKPPTGIGKLSPHRFALELDAAAPRHRMIFRAGQCRGGRPVPNENGRVIADWNAVISRQKVSVECLADDADESGVVWLLLTVDSPPGTPSASWLIHTLEVAYNATVVERAP